MSQKFAAGLGLLISVAACVLSFGTAMAQGAPAFACTAPQQFETQVFLIRGDGHKGPRSFLWSYDFAHRQQRFDYFTTGKVVIQKDVAGHFYQYTIAPDQTCIYRELSQGMEQFGVPADFLSKNDFGEYTEYVFGPGKADDDSSVHRFSGSGLFIVVDAACAPVFTQGLQKHQKAAYLALELGIRNPNAFNTPANCTLKP